MSNSELLRQFAEWLETRAPNAGAATSPVDKAQQLAEYADVLSAQGLSARTIECYVGTLRTLERKYKLNVWALTAPAVISWASSYSRIRAARSVATTYSALRKWAEFTGQSHAVGSLEGPPVDHTPQPLPPMSDVERIRDAMRPSKHARSEQARRKRQDGVVFDLLFEGALRISEALALDLDDLKTRDPRGGMATRVAPDAVTHLWIRRSKRGKSRMVPLTPAASRSLTNWVDVHRPATGERAVFLNVYGRRLSYHAYWERLRAYARETGVHSIEGKTHTGRRVKLTDLVARGAKPNAIIKISGHKSVRELEPYISLSDDQAEREWLEFSAKRVRRKNA